MKSKNKKAGFTLVEMIVSLAIFSIVAVVALGALIRIIDANKKAQTLQTAITNLNYALESLSREMRVGTKYQCGQGGGEELDASLNNIPCTIDGREGYIAFLSSRVDPDCEEECNLVTVYRFVGGDGSYILEKAIQRDYEVSTSNNDFSSIIDENLTIADFYMKVTGDEYPLAYIHISGYAGQRERERTYFDLQTAVSSRISN